MLESSARICVSNLGHFEVFLVGQDVTIAMRNALETAQNLWDTMLLWKWLKPS